MLAVSGSNVRVLHASECSLKCECTEILWEDSYQLNGNEFIVAEIETSAGNDRTFYRDGALNLVPAAAAMTYDAENHTVTVSADEYVHAIELEGDAVFSDNCFSLLPGEVRTISFTPIAESDITLTAYSFEK